LEIGIDLVDRPYFLVERMEMANGAIDLGFCEKETNEKLSWTDYITF
jgi:hypothetical protein